LEGGPAGSLLYREARLAIELIDGGENALGCERVFARLNHSAVFKTIALLGQLLSGLELITATQRLLFARRMVKGLIV